MFNMVVNIEDIDEKLNLIVMCFYMGNLMCLPLLNKLLPLDGEKHKMLYDKLSVVKYPHHKVWLYIMSQL